MSKIDVTDPSLTTLLDDYAMNAMVALMQVYEPEESPKDHDDANEWCDWCDFISTRSYYMAAAMMDARSSFHNVLIDCAKEKEQDAA
jgi:hypothetical protein